MAEKEQEIEVLEETQPTTLMDDADTTAEKKRPGPIKKVAAFVTATTASIDKFVTTIHNYKPYVLQ